MEHIINRKINFHISLVFFLETFIDVLTKQKLRLKMIFISLITQLRLK